MSEKNTGLQASVWSAVEQVGQWWRPKKLAHDRLRSDQQSRELLAAEDFNLSDFFADSDTNPVVQGIASPLVDIAQQGDSSSGQDPQVGEGVTANAVQNEGSAVMSSPRSLAAVWRAMAVTGQQRFTKSVTANSFQVGASLAESTMSWLGTAVGACGPLCFHGLSSAGSVVGSGRISGGFGNGIGGGLFGGESSSGFDWSTAARELERSGSFWFGDRKVTWHDLMWIWSHTVSEGLYHMLGFGIIDCLIDGLIPGHSRQSTQLA